MRNIVIVLIGLSILSFVLAAIVTLIGGSFTIMGIVGPSPEAFSRASNNLALIAIALTLVFIGVLKEK